MKYFQPLLMLLVLVLGAPATAAPAGKDQGKSLTVVASIAPLGRIAAVVAGQRAEVVVLAPAGADPHTFEPKPSQMALIAKAGVFLAQGVEYEHAWLPRFQKSNPRLVVVNTTAGIDLLLLADHDHDHDKAAIGHDKATQEHQISGHDQDKADSDQQKTAHDQAKDDHDKAAQGQEKAGKDHERDKPAGVHGHDGDHDDDHEAMTTDPHTWTSPMLAAKQAETIAQALTKADPEGASAYQAGLAAFQAEAKALDAAIRQKLSGVMPGAKFVTFHPAWTYFAKAYGLTEVAIQAGGREPGPKTLQRIIDQAKGQGVKMVLVQPQFSRKSAQAVADAIGARLVVADPLAEDWQANLLGVADAIARAAR